MFRLLPLQALKDRRMLAVNRQNPRPALPRRRRHDLARRDQHFFGRQRDIFARSSAAMVASVPTAPATETTTMSASGSVARRTKSALVAPFQLCLRDAELLRLFPQQSLVAEGGQADDVQTVRQAADDIQRLRPDAAGRAENDDALQGDFQARPRRTCGRAADNLPARPSSSAGVKSGHSVGVTQISE